jgi:phage terminase large subunit
MGRSLQLPTPRAYIPLLEDARYKGVYGGRGSAKSHFFANALLERCVVRPGTRFMCVREIQLTLKQSVKRLLEDKIEEHKLTNEFGISNTEISTPGGGVIIFLGMQDHTADSIKSLEGFDGAWVEEAQSLSERSLTLLRPTIRKPGSELWFSWNPKSPKDPVDKLLRGSSLPPGAIVIRTSWRDNPWFPDVLKKEMLWDRGRDPEKYAHVWLGEYERKSEARVFKNWTIQEVEPPEDTIFRFGGDWGFSVDPTVALRSWLLDERTLVFDREAYRIGCEIDDIPKLFDGLECGCDYTSPRPCRHPEGHAMARLWPLVADSARPETISYLQRHGYPRIEAAIKGANSVKEGVIFLQGYNILVHPDCTHTIDELVHYSYKVDKDGTTVLPILEDKKNHVIDSARYATESLRRPVVDDWISA